MVFIRNKMHLSIETREESLSFHEVSRECAVDYPGQHAAHTSGMVSKFCSEGNEPIFDELGGILLDSCCSCFTLSSPFRNRAMLNGALSEPNPDLSRLMLSDIASSFTVRAEATAVLVLGVSRYLFVAWADVGVLSFGYAQLLHSATLAAAYLLSAARQVTKPGNRTAINPAGADPATETHGVNKCSQVKCASSVGGCEEECSDAAVVDAIDKTTMCSKNGDDSRGSGFALTSGWLPRRPRNSWKLAAGQLAPVGAMAAKSGTIASERSERTQIREQSMKGAAGTAHAAVDYEWVDREKIRLAGAVAGQSVLKHVLTEGDKIVLARASSSFGRVKCSGGGVGSRDEIDGVCENRSSGGGSLYEQGVYAVASGYGSLAARLLFQPLEEAARLMFSKLGAEEDELKRIHQGRQQQREGKRQQGQMVVREDCDGAFDQSPSQRCSSPRRAGVESSISQRLLPVEQNCSADGGGDAAGVPPLVQHKVMEQDLGGARYRIRVRMAYLLATLLKLVLMAGLIFVCFGFHYTETLLRLLLARRDRDGVDNSHGNNTVSEVATVLSWYCVYVLFLAANGMCEAFACAVARGRQLTGMGVGLIASFAAFWALVGPLTGR